MVEVNAKTKINPYSANVENMVSSSNSASKWQMGFNSAFKWINKSILTLVRIYLSLDIV